MADDRIRELEIIIRLIDIEFILARRSQQKEKKKEASLDKRMAQQKWSEGLCSLFCILAGRIFHGGDSFGDLLLLWRHYVASTLLFQGGSR